MSLQTESTRNAAYFDHRDSGRLSAQERTIMLALHSQPGRDWSLQEIVALTGLGVNAVSGRCNGLKTKPPYLLIECAKRRCAVTGKTIVPLRINNGELFA